MTYVLDPKSAVRHRLVIELRYESGELYWDRSGRIARTLAHREGWLTHSIDTNGCHIQKEDQNLVFSFSPTKLSLSQSQSQDVSELLSSGEFAAIAEEFSEIVVNSLDVEFLPRMGFRAWVLYPTESLDDASSRVSKMSFFAPCKALTDLGQLSYISHSVVVARPDHMIRVAATPFEQQINLAPSIVAAARVRARDHWTKQKQVLVDQLKAKKAIKAYPRMGIMVDMDAFIEDLQSAKQLPICRFIDGATIDFNKISSTILSEGDGMN